MSLFNYRCTRSRQCVFPQPHLEFSLEGPTPRRQWRNTVMHAGGAVAGLSAERGSPPHYRLSSHNRQANGAAHTTVTPLARRTQQRPERSAPWPTRPKDRARPPPRPNALRRAQQQRGKTTKPRLQTLENKSQGQARTWGRLQKHHGNGRVSTQGTNTDRRSKD